MRVWVIFLFVFMAVFPVHAAEVDLDKNHVDISTGFAGEELTVFGVRENAGVPLAVVVTGPRKEMVVRKKSRVFGAWMNTSGVRFKDVPLFYDYAVYGQDEGAFQMKPADLMSADKERDGEKLARFQEALIRNKTEIGHYAPAPAVMKVYENSGLFRVDFRLPSNVPVGEYTVRVFEGDEQTAVAKTFIVSQTGGSAQIKYFAVNRPFIYGLGCVMFALFAGWFSSRVRRRA